MEGRGFGFVTFRDASHAQQFLEVRGLSRLRSMLDALLMTDWALVSQQREHVIDSKKVEAKAAVPKNSGSSSTLTRKMFVGGTVSLCLVGNPSVAGLRRFVLTVWAYCRVKSLTRTSGPTSSNLEKSRTAWCALLPASVSLFFASSAL